jgi:predicted O-methyltransferase YrrM
VNITNPLVAEYLEGFFTPINESLAEIRRYAEDRHIPIITKDVERLLAVLLAGMKPQFVLEIGTAIGYSAAFMTTSWTGCQVDTIEMNQEAYDTAQVNLKKLDLLERVHVFYGDATEIMNNLIDQRMDQHKKTDFFGYDLIFIDASKSKYTSFFKQAMKLVRPGGLILCDNVLMRGTVANDCYDPEGKHKTSVKNIRAFLSYISTLETVETAILPIGDGISMSINKPK